jgi:hypothetical protein
VDIAEKKEQILELIEKLNPESSRSASRQSRGTAILKHPMSDRLAWRRQKLAELRQRREKTGLDLLEARMLKTCQMLEERIARIERVIGLGNPQKTASAAQDAPDGTDFAPVLKPMEPCVHSEAPSSNLQPGRPTALQAPTAKKERIYTLSGVIQEGVLADILQLLSSNQKTGSFTADADGKKVEMYFRDGHLYHATCGDISGQSAFFVAMALEKGTFCFEESAQLPDEVTIDGNTQFMILEALRQIDEERTKK